MEKNLDLKIRAMAARIKELREIEGITIAEMAEFTGVTEEEYAACERGERDLNFAFIYRTANALKVNVTDIIEGASPLLSSYTLTRSGKGQRISGAHGLTYYNLAAAFQNRIAEPLYVRSKYVEGAENKEIECTTHAGQECDIVVSGKLMVQVGGHREILSAGDSIYYDSSTPHGMIAVGGKDCVFYAIVLNPSGEPIPDFQPIGQYAADTEETEKKDDVFREYNNYVDVTENEQGAPQTIKFKNTDNTF